MGIFSVSESGQHADRILYIHDCLVPLLTECGAAVRLYADDSRAGMQIHCEDGVDELLSGELYSLIAEVIAVGYKYAFFELKIKPYGLSEQECELLLCALIAADVEEDKRYVKRLCESKKEIAVDGMYHFLLGALREKWNEIVGYIPTVFTGSELSDFIVFLLKEKAVKTCFVEEKTVCDATFRPLRLTQLAGGDKPLKIVREILLSGATDVEYLTDIPKEDEAYVRQFFGHHVNFRV